MSWAKLGKFLPVSCIGAGVSGVSLGDEMAEAPNIYALLNQAGWIQDLARSLVLDPNQADDVVQETWVSALEKRPDTSRPVRGWLATVLRSHVAKLRRREEVRSRDAELGPAQEGPSAFEVLDRATTHRDLVEAVLQLEEPYRGTILLRFFEHLSYEDIARRDRVTLAAVNSRVTRGLEQLRRKLETVHGGDRRALFTALAPLVGKPAALTVPATAGVSFMGILAGAGFLTAVVTAVIAFDGGSSSAPGGTGAALEAEESFLATAEPGELEPWFEPQPGAGGRVPLAFVAKDGDWVAHLGHTLLQDPTLERLSLNSGAGDVQVVPSTAGQILIEADIRADRDEVEAHELTYEFFDHVVLDQKGALLEVKDAHKENGWSVSLTVHVPAALDVQANSGAGAVVVKTARAKVQANSGAGSVRVLLAEKSLESIQANSGAGEVEVLVGSVRERLLANSGAGAVQAEVSFWDSPGKVQLNSGAGSVKLVVPPNVAGTFDLRTNLGDIDLPDGLPLERESREMGEVARGQVGRGGGQYALKTGVGGVAVEFLGTGANRTF